MADSDYYGGEGEYQERPESIGYTASQGLDFLDLSGGRAKEDAERSRARARHMTDQEMRRLSHWFYGGTPQMDEQERYARQVRYLDPAINELTGGDYETLGDESALQNVFADRLDVHQQTEALKAMQQVYQQGGMTAADRDRLRLGQQEQMQAMRGAQQATMQNMAERGMGGSGTQLASLLSAQQGAQQGLANQNAQMNIAAQQRALEAMRNSFQMASDMRQRGVSEAAGRASAADRHNQYNLGLRNANRDRRGQAARDLYGAQERRTALRLGQYQGEADRAERDYQAAQDKQDGAINAAVSAFAG